MTFETFQHIILEQLNARIAEPKKMRVEPFPRINGQILNGLIIMQNEVNVSPAIYLEPYYEAYQNGETIPGLVDAILSVYEKNRTTLSLDSSFFTDFSNIRDHIVYKLINYRMNETLLTEVPHYRFLDLAVVFYFLLFSEKNGTASILIRNRHLAYWNADSEQIYALARKNTPRLLPHVLQSMGEILCRDSSPGEAGDPPMYVLTTRNNLNGACTMLYPNLIQSIAGEMNTDFYILPSSIHEVILLPAADCSSIEKLSEMVTHINEMEVAEEEILSGHAYYYSRKDNCISM